MVHHVRIRDHFRVPKRCSLSIGGTASRPAERCCGPFKTLLPPCLAVCMRRAAGGGNAAPRVATGRKDEDVGERRSIVAHDRLAEASTAV